MDEECKYEIGKGRTEAGIVVQRWLMVDVEHGEPKDHFPPKTTKIKRVGVATVYADCDDDELAVAGLPETLEPDLFTGHFC